MARSASPTKLVTEEHDEEVVIPTEETPLIQKHNENTRTDGGKRANLVLFTCCLLQFPVWGFAMSYGVFQDYYTSVADQFDGDISQTGIIGTTLHGIMYLSMPALFYAYSHKLRKYRKHSSLIGACLSALSLLCSSFATTVWELILFQGVLQAVGSAVLYSSTTMYLDEWFIKKKGFAYGAILGLKSFVGVGMPVLFGFVLKRLSFEWTLRIWSIASIILTIPAILLLKHRHISQEERSTNEKQGWAFLRYPSFYIFQAANIIFSTSYGLPQTYLPQFASSVLGLPASDSTLILVALNLPSCVASFWFGLLSDGKGLSKGKSLSIAYVSLLSALGAGLPTFLFWATIPGPGPAGVSLLTLFAIFYGFFAGGYSATWGGVCKEISREADSRNDAVNTGLLFGILNGGRGIGFIAGGFIGVQLLKDGAVPNLGWAMGTTYGSLILFIGISSALGGISVLYKSKKATPK